MKRDYIAACRVQSNRQGQKTGSKQPNHCLMAASTRKKPRGFCWKLCTRGDWSPHLSYSPHVCMTCCNHLHAFTYTVFFGHLQNPVRNSHSREENRRITHYVKGNIFMASLDTWIRILKNNKFGVIISKYGCKIWLSLEPIFKLCFLELAIS